MFMIRRIITSLSAGADSATSGPTDQLQGSFEFLSIMLESLPVKGVAANQVIAEGFGGPLAKRDAASGVDPVADRDNGIEVVMRKTALDSSSALSLNYREILGT